MEEIDIIELLKRVKEGKTPKRIEIDGTKYEFQENCSDIVCIYKTEDYDDWLENESIYLDTKIKILDKPIIEELPTTEIVHNFEDNSTYEIEKAYSTDELADKINEIIRVINNKE